jgi:gamma-glutamyl-gamma-aminobutyrate hydrolase PuuD
VNRPTVLVVARRLERKGKPVNWVHEAHLALLLQERVIPVMVPLASSPKRVLAAYRRDFDGLLLVEGGDIHPHAYDADPAVVERTVLDDVDVAKDEIEIGLCRAALARGVPVLAICRGMQLLNVVCGGSLHLDVQRDVRGGLAHVDDANYDGHRHSIEISRGTPLRQWYGRANMSVNSYHHQGIARLADRLSPMAHSPDGLVEAYRDPLHRFLVGLQFHPERMLDERPEGRRVYKAFAQAVHASVDSGPRRR